MSEVRTVIDLGNFQFSIDSDGDLTIELYNRSIGDTFTDYVWSEDVSKLRDFLNATIKPQPETKEVIKDGGR